MKKTFKNIRKISTIVLMTLIAIVSYLPAKPAHALLGEGDEVQDPIVETQTSIINGEDTISAAANDNLWIKEYVLDPIAWMVAKTMVQSMTNSTVAWINGGFNGSPAFIQDPEQFFMKLGDNIAGNFTMLSYRSKCPPSVSIEFFSGRRRNH